MPSVHDFSEKTIDGTEKKLADYKGQVLLIVNVASKCGLTPQYEGLEKLNKEYGAARASRARVSGQRVRRAGAGHATTRSSRSARRTTASISTCSARSW